MAREIVSGIVPRYAAKVGFDKGILKNGSG